MIPVRDATSEDADSVCSVHEAAIRGLGPAAYDDEQVDAWAGDRDADDYDVEADDAEFLVVERDGRVAGFGELRPDGGDYFEAVDDGPGTGEVRALYVHPNATGEGVGSALLAELERRARGHGLDALGLQSSLNAVQFYETHGYDRVKEVDHEFGETGVHGTVVEMRTDL